MTRPAAKGASHPQSNNFHNLGGRVIVEENIRGNAPEKIKSLGSKIFWQQVDGDGLLYGSDTGRKLRFTEINISGSDLPNLPETSVTKLVKSYKGRDDLTVETVFEVVVDEDMCNAYGTLHGGCAAYFMDPCSISPLVILGLLLGVDGTGLTQSMNMIWHRPIYTGTLIHIKSTSVFLAGRVRTARCEIWAKNKLCISAVHSIINPTAGRPKGKL